MNVMSGLNLQHKESVTYYWIHFLVATAVMNNVSKKELSFVICILFSVATRISTMLHMEESVIGQFIERHLSIVNL